jgi:hypothetical protein
MANGEREWHTEEVLSKLLDAETHSTSKIVNFVKTSIMKSTLSLDIHDNRLTLQQVCGLE